MELQAFGLRLKERRERRRLRQADVAAALQVSAQAVSKWERGENAPDITLLVPLSRLLDVSLEWLLAGSHPDTETFAATVFMADLKGYAQQAAGMAPRGLADWINGVHFAVTEAVLRYDGVPVKTMGDATLAFFAGGLQADRALSAARSARERVGREDLMVTLHRGEIYLGTIGHPEYARLDILGETVNTAVLLSVQVDRYCPDGIGLTGSVAAALSEERRDTVRPCGTVEVRGRDEAVALYTPRPLDTLRDGN